jgi:IPT/TIG domain
VAHNLAHELLATHATGAKFGASGAQWSRQAPPAATTNPTLVSVGVRGSNPLSSDPDAPDAAEDHAHRDAADRGRDQPGSGGRGGGTVVTVTGTGFVPRHTTVTIGGTTIPACAVTVTSLTTLTFHTPAHGAGLVTLSVSTPSGTSAPLSFTYLTAAARRHRPAHQRACDIGGTATRDRQRGAGLHPPTDRSPTPALIRRGNEIRYHTRGAVVPR